MIIALNGTVYISRARACPKFYLLDSISLYNYFIKLVYTNRIVYKDFLSTPPSVRECQLVELVIKRFVSHHLVDEEENISVYICIP